MSGCVVAVLCVILFCRIVVYNVSILLMCRVIMEDEAGCATDGPPQFTMRLRDRRVQMTYPVRLTCQVAGRPTPEVTWAKDGKEIVKDGQ